MKKKYKYIRITDNERLILQAMVDSIAKRNGDISRFMADKIVEVITHLLERSRDYEE